MLEEMLLFFLQIQILIVYLWQVNLMGIYAGSN